VQHTLYGLEALMYKLSVLMMAASLALVGAVDFAATPGERLGLHQATKSTLLCAMLLRVVTPLQSVSALFIADIGRYVGHTPGELQEIRCVHHPQQQQQQQQQQQFVVGLSPAA
jgi:hypothetical protein